MIIETKIIFKVGSQNEYIKNDYRLFFKHMYSDLEFSPHFSENQVRVLSKTSITRYFQNTGYSKS